MQLGWWEVLIGGGWYFDEGWVVVGGAVVVDELGGFDDH